MSNPADLLAQSLSSAKLATRISGNKNSYRRDSPTEYAAVMAYLGGGARPTVSTQMGKHLVLEEDVRRLLIAPPQPSPPGLGVLMWRPPGWNGGDPTLSSSFPGYTVQNVSGNAAVALTLNDSTDYYINLGDLIPVPAVSGRTNCLHISGGRNVVIVGGNIYFRPDRTDDDPVAIMIDAGNAAGTVHLEGLSLDCLNGPTIRSSRMVQIENCYINVNNDPFNRGVGGHPDIVQTWAGGNCGVRMNRVTGHSNFTGLSVLVDATNGCPVTWETYDVSIHPQPSLDVAWPDVHPARYFGFFTDHSGGNNWIDTSKFSSSGLRKLDDILIEYATDATQTVVYAPYEIHDPSGTLIYTSPLVPTGGNGPYPQGATQGYEIRYTRAFAQNGNHIDETWKYGRNPVWPNGEVCPLSTVGINYVSPGYQ